MLQAPCRIFPVYEMCIRCVWHPEHKRNSILARRNIVSNHVASTCPVSNNCSVTILILYNYAYVLLEFLYFFYWLALYVFCVFIIEKLHTLYQINVNMGKQTAIKISNDQMKLFQKILNRNKFFIRYVLIFINNKNGINSSDFLSSINSSPTFRIIFIIFLKTFSPRLYHLKRK